MNLTFFIGVPKLAEFYWPTFMRLKDDFNIDIYQHMVIHVTAFQFATLILGNLFFFFCYRGKFAFIEKYKSVEDPWPWESDKQEWNKLFWRSIRLSVFNAVVMNTLLVAPTILKN